MAARPGSRSIAGLNSEHIPDPTAEVGHCVHRIAMHPSRPDVLFMQKHWDVMRTDDAGDNWREVSGNLPTDFGFAIDVHAHEPETVYVVPIKSDSEHFPPEGKLRVYRSRSGGERMGSRSRTACRRATATSTCCATPWRSIGSRLAACIFGTTGGQVYASTDGGDTGPHRSRSAGGALRGSADAGMIRVVLPAHLRALAGVGASWRSK